MPGALGRVVAIGNTAVVHEWTPTTVVKLLRPDTPVAWAAMEALWTSRLHDLGLPVLGVDGGVG